MRIDVEIVTGFLGCGKTSFINSLLKESQVDGEKILILQLEDGNRKIYSTNDINYPVKTIKIKDVLKVKECFYELKDKYKPNRIIIEYNGTCDLNEIKELLNEKELKKYMKISTVYFVADIRNLKRYIESLGCYIIPFIQSSNMVIVNNTEDVTSDELKSQIDRIKGMNPKTFILNVDNRFNLSNELRKSHVINNGYLKKMKIKLMNR